MTPGSRSARSAEPVVLLVPSRAAAVELPRRVAATGQALSGLYPLVSGDLVRALAEPALLGRGLKAWNPGHGALLASRLLDGPHGLRLPAEVPRAPVAAALARTLAALRAAAVDPPAVAVLAARASGPEDEERLRALAHVHREFLATVEGRFADPFTLTETAARALEASGLRGARVIVTPGFDPDPLERRLLAAFAAAGRLQVLELDPPASLLPSSLCGWARAHAVPRVGWSETPLAPLAPPEPPAGLQRLRTRLFEPPAGSAVRDGSVELKSAPGEAAEVRSVARRLLQLARAGVPFEDMAVLLPRPEDYASLFADLLTRLGVPYRLHPSLPLRHGRCARSLLLLLRCRGLARPAVMELFTFAPLKFPELLSRPDPPPLAQWDALSRDVGIVSGLARWIIGLRAHAESEREAAAREAEPERARRRRQRAADAEELLHMVELLSGTLDGLSGEASWPEWSQRLLDVLEQWIGPDRDRPALVEVLQDLGALGDLGARASWAEVESVLEARLEWERVPLPPTTSGAVHVGALDALAGLPFRVVAVVGLVEGGYPGVLRADPFLLDAERLALRPPAAAPAPAPPPPPRPRTPPRQLSLFDAPEPAPPPAPADAASGPADLPTTQDRLLEARRLFHRALSQATERLILSYPRADARTGRERMPSLFFASAATALAGEPLGSAELERLVVEDDLETLELEDALDRGERDRLRVRRGGRTAIEAIASGSPFFRQSVLATHSRWLGMLTPYDGLVAFPKDLAGTAPALQLLAKLDPTADTATVSASRLATFTRCGFQYLLQHVLKLEPALEPEERKRLDPLERGNAFHETAEAFLRERRDRGELPVTNSPANQARLRELGDAALEALVAGAPPRFTALWQRERQRFHDTLLKWLEREAGQADRSTPIHLEVAFGLKNDLPPNEPHRLEPLVVELGDGRTLRVNGRIDRIDRGREGGLVLRDYKTGKAPKTDDASFFKAGQHLQIPMYVLAARELFPEQEVVEAFLDYVDGGRQVALDPRSVAGEAFRAHLREIVDLIGQGIFVQEPSVCDWCDYQDLCGPKPLLERRRRLKLSDPRVQKALRLREL